MMIIFVCVCVVVTPVLVFVFYEVLQTSCNVRCTAWITCLMFYDIVVITIFAVVVDL